MTEMEFYLTCLGFKRKKLIEAKQLRTTQWLILNSFADQSKLPRNESAWMPLAGEPKPKPYKAPSKKILQKYIEQFKQLKLK